MRRPLRLASLTSIALLFACGGSSAPDGFADDAGPASDTGAAIADAGPTADVSLGGEVDAAPKLIAEVYGHSDDTLYKLDPDTKAVIEVGKFQGCTKIIDIALDKDSNLYGTTSTALWGIDRKTAACTRIAGGAYPNSLSFVPAGTLDPSAEALVGYDGATYVRIDPASGTKTTVGALGGGLKSSGDIVSVKGGGTFLTVKGTGCDDCLVEINPSTGALVKNWGDVGHTDIFGLAFWAGSVFAFDNGGELFEVTFAQGAIKTAPIAMPQKPAGLKFWGAGSTTSAPVVRVN
jgi:hypothetical protein